ncbi:MAG: hypothetical protein KatS3mg105_3933 [Gemmatales bacterium]|nr:MAG: hypothetical protein KatS3mg105_3933 [Gemmatales bacterium]
MRESLLLVLRGEEFGADTATANLAAPARRSLLALMLRRSLL